MSNVIKYTTTPVNNTIKKGNFALGINDVDYGPTNITGFYMTTIPSTSGYTIYNENGGTLSYQSVSGTTPLISYLSNKRGVNMTTAGESLSWAAGQSNIFVTNREYENIVTSGMVLNLDAGFVSSYPTSATTWYDLSYSGNNGTLTNGPTFNSFSGGSIVFDGVDDSVVCGTGTTTLLSSMTISSTFSFTTFTNGTHVIVGRLGNISNSYNHNYFFGIQQSKFYFGFKHATQETFPLVLLTDFLPVTGVTYNLTATYSTTSSVRIYLNGVEQGYSGLNTLANPLITNQPVRNDSRTILSVGAGYGENAFFSNCKIYSTQLYNRVLSPFEVYQNYNAMKGRFGIPDIVTSGLTLNLDAGNPYSYNPLNTGSTTWSNTTNTTTGGTLTNGTFYSGGTMVFDGVDDYVNGTLSSFNVGSINMWFNPAQLINASSSGTSLLTLRWNGTENSEWYIGLGSITTILVNEYITILDVTNNSRTAITDGGSLSANTWYNLVINSESNYYEIYLNGQYKTTTRSNGGVTTLTNPNTLGIGALTRNILTSNFNGKISTTSLYNRGLSPSEIYQNFNSIKNRYGYYDIVQEGLVLNLDAGNPNSYSRLNTGSTTWNDVSGYGNNGTLINGTYYSGGTMVFDGVNDYVNLTSPTNLNLGTNNFSVNTWFMLSGLPSGESYPNSYWVFGTGPQLSITNTQIYVGANRIHFDLNTDGGGPIDINHGFVINTWYNISLVRNGNTFKIFKNGVLLQSNTSSQSAVNGYDWAIGKPEPTPSSTIGYFNGKISSFAVYNGYALSDAEVLQNFNATRYKYGV